MNIKLLLTDVVMPDVNGKKLADEALIIRPRTPKVLFTTGYTRNAVVHSGVLDPGVQVEQAICTGATRDQCPVSSGLSDLRDRLTLVSHPVVGMWTMIRSYVQRNRQSLEPATFDL